MFTIQIVETSTGKPLEGKKWALFLRDGSEDVRMTTTPIKMVKFIFLRRMAKEWSMYRERKSMKDG